MRRLFLIAILLLGFSVQTLASTIVPSTFEGELHLTKENSPYIAQDGGILVGSGNTLIIDPGVNILFPPQTGIVAYGGGNIKIGNSASSDKVVFKLDYSSGVTNVKWAGLMLDSGASAEIHSLYVSGAYVPFGMAHASATVDDLVVKDGYNNVSIKDSDARISSSSFSNIQAASIEISNSTGYLKDSIIFNNLTGITIKNSPNFLISNNTITENDIAISSYPENIAFNAGGNYWGDYGIPAKGEFSGNVNFDPALPTSPQDFDPCCSSVVFLPGFEGTRLYQGKNQLWEPNWNADVEKLFLNEKGESVTPNIQTGDIIKKTNIGFGIFDKPLYQGISSMFDSIVSDGTMQYWNPLPYDWRFFPFQFDMYKYITLLAQTSKTGKVILIGHSNGGLAIKYFLAKIFSPAYRKLRIESVILVDTPQIGAPEAIGGLLHGDNQQIANGIILGKPTGRKLGQNMVSAYNLLPSPFMYSVESPFVKFDPSTDLVGSFREFYGDSILSHHSMNDFLSAGFSNRSNPPESNTSLPAILRSDLLGVSDENHALLDNLVPDVPVFQIGATGFPTTEGITYLGHKSCYFTAGPICVDKYDLVHTPTKINDGDGTVPLKSSLFMEYPNVSSFTFDIGAYNLSENKNYSHADILEAQPIQDLIKDIITRKTNLSRNSRNSGSGNRSIYQYSIYFSANVDAYDQNGLHTGPVNYEAATDLSFVEANIPNSTYEQDEQETYITISGNNGPTRIRSLPRVAGNMSIEIIYTDENSVETKIHFDDIAVEEGNVVDVDTDPTSSSTTPVMNVYSSEDDAPDKVPEVPGVLPEPEPETEPEPELPQSTPDPEPQPGTESVPEREPPDSDPESESESPKSTKNTKPPKAATIEILAGSSTTLIFPDKNNTHENKDPDKEALGDVLGTAEVPSTNSEIAPDPIFFNSASLRYPSLSGIFFSKLQRLQATISPVREVNTPSGFGRN